MNAVPSISACTVPVALPPIYPKICSACSVVVHDNPRATLCIPIVQKIVLPTKSGKTLPKGLLDVRHQRCHEPSNEDVPIPDDFEHAKQILRLPTVVPVRPSFVTPDLVALPCIDVVDRSPNLPILVSRTIVVPVHVHVDSDTGPRNHNIDSNDHHPDSSMGHAMTPAPLPAETSIDNSGLG